MNTEQKSKFPFAYILYKCLIGIGFLFCTQFLKSDPIYSVGSLFWGEHRILKNTKGGEVQTTYPAKSSGFAWAGLSSKGNQEKFSHSIGVQFLADFTNPSSAKIFLGEEAFVGIHYQKASFLIGRKILKSQEILSYNKDGLEGIGLQYQFSENSNLHVNFLDYYRGFPLLENSAFWIPEKKENLVGNRFRHGIVYNHKKDFWNSNVFFQYMQLGDWGESSVDNLRESTRRDRDFLYHAGLHFGIEFSYIQFGLTGILSRGLDKTSPNEVRKNSSLPITGEALLGKIAVHLPFLEFKYNFFLPDRDKRNEALDVLETGFIGMGSNPMRGKLLSQIIHFYPSGWVTPEGMQRSKSIELGRFSSLLNQVELTYKASWGKVGIFCDHITPYLIQPSRGTLSFQRRDFSKYYLVEGGLSIQLGTQNKGDYFVELVVSAVQSSKELGIRGTIGYISGGIYF